MKSKHVYISVCVIIYVYIVCIVLYIVCIYVQGCINRLCHYIKTVFIKESLHPPIAGEYYPAPQYFKGMPHKY